MRFFSAACQIQHAPPSTVTLLYSEELTLHCECSAIPKPDVSWIFNSDLYNIFKTKDHVTVSQSGACNNTLHSGKSLTWSEDNIDERFRANQEQVLCRCRNSVEDVIWSPTHLNVLCKSKFYVT